jgi:hypothetical protein
MSQQASQSTTIDGVKFEVFMLDPDKAMKHSLSLLKIIGPGAGAIADLKQSGGLENVESIGDLDWGDDGFQRLFSAILDKIDSEFLLELINDLSEVSEVEPGGNLQACRALLFRGKTALQFKWLWFALKVNYQDFSGALGSVFGPQGNNGAPARPSPSPST